MKSFSFFVLVLVLAATAAAQTTPLVNARVRGTLTIEATGTLTLASGATLNLPTGLIEFSDLGATPTTLAGYGITDAATFAQGALADTALQTPGSSAEGDILFRNSTVWTRLPRGTTGQLLTATATTIEWDDAPTSGFANPMTTEGDIIVGDTAGAAERLGIGTEGQVLKVVSGAIAWDTDSTGSGSLPGTPAEGDLAYYDGADWVSLAIGTATQVLTVNATADAPEWAAAAGGGGGSLTLARWTALDNQPPAATFATFDTRNSIAVLDFDAGTAESAVFVGVIPEGADFTTGIAVRIVWTATSATSGDVIWTAAFERGNTDLDSDSFATGIDSAAATTNGTSGIATTTTINHSGSEIDGVTAGDLFRLKITRKAADGSDTMTGDAELIAVEIRQR